VGWLWPGPAVEDLLKTPGIDVNATDENGNTALLDAARFGHDHVVRVLLAAGANMKVRDKEKTPLMQHHKIARLKDNQVPLRLENFFQYRDPIHSGTVNDGTPNNRIEEGTEMMRRRVH
jgi:ankyrin repeat protein